ncbi:MAG: hypothetical protein LQ338_003254 [Usnochroma carphineum]|nr:MAG: hypothetical protein LQ338_003254 [Usnochroma carphineum]
MARNKERLSLDDLPMISHYMRSRPLLARCGYNSAKRRLWKRLLYLFKWAFLSQFGLTLVTSVSQFGPQYAMYRLLLFLERRQQVTQEGYIMWLWVLGLASSMFFNSVAESQLSWMSWSQLAIPIRALLSILISTKSMRRKDTKGAHKSMHVASAGGLSAAESRLSDSLGEGPALTKDPEITASKTPPNITQGTSNLVAVDSKRVSDFASLCWFFPASTVRLILSVCFLYSLIGWASLLAGLLAWLLTVPINAFVSKRYSHLQGHLMAARDRRLAVLTQALQSIRQIKFCAHERRWRAKISQEREQELAVQWKAFVYQAGLFCLLTSGPLMLSTVALLTYACLHKTLLPSVAFTTIAILGHLEFTMTVIPQLITDAIAAWVSLSRIEEYLNAPETEVDELAGRIALPQALDERFDHKATQDNWIISSLKAYVAQTPFIENATIRDNITFGLPLDQTRYQKTVSVCALTKDLEVFSDGDLTDLGATGINLSGGQRWRISFARALYSRAGILILDGILSSLDSQVGRHIVEEALTSDLAEGRTRILVTHLIDLCRSMTAYAVVLGHGSVEYAGSVEGLNRNPRLKGVTQPDADENELVRRTVMEGDSVKELSGVKCHGGYENPT